MKPLFIDIETSTKDTNNIMQIGAIDGSNNFVYKGDNIKDFNKKTEPFDYIVGHNVLNHDLVHLSKEKNIELSFFSKPVIDTLWLSSLIFIKKPYHKLIKDYKIDKINDPVEDSKLCRDVFEGCIAEFSKIDSKTQAILFNLLSKQIEFAGFFDYYAIAYNKKFDVLSTKDLVKNIQVVLKGIVDQGFDIENFVKKHPKEFAYVFRLLQIKLTVDKELSVLPKWIIHNLPNTYEIVNEILKHKKYEIKQELKRFFGYDNFRTFKTDTGEEISQEEVVKDTLAGKNILTVFATGGGKSLTFQLPALINADKINCLTIIISPLQSLMKDQVDNLNNKHDIQNVGFLNGLLNPLERKEVIEKVEYGGIDILYVSPEMLRSPNTKSILSGRIIDRIVIDEAHCFSKWGHDFRIDYMFIADFIKELGEANPSIKNVKISCFTATAKHEVIEEIKAYFHNNLGINLEEFKSTIERDNLKYSVIEVGNESDRSKKFIEYIKENVLDSFCIVFVRKTKKAQEISEFINSELGNISSFYHGKLDIGVKRDIQDEFMTGQKRIIVATNAFGMGIDKEDVRYVIHYEVPTSIENYVQEAGRAGRDGRESNCVIFYNNTDLDENFRLIKQGEVRAKEIKDLLRTIKNCFEKSQTGIITMSAKELVTKSRLNNDFEEREKNREMLETKIKTALYFLEKQEFIKRGFNNTRVFATSKGFKSLNEGIEIIDKINEFDETQKNNAKKIIQNILSGKTIQVEEIPDEIGIRIREVLVIINTLRKYKLIEKENDLSLYLNIDKGDNTSESQLNIYKEILARFFDVISKKYPIDTGTEMAFDKVLINTEISKSLGKNSLKNELNDIYNFLKGLRESTNQNDSKKYITIRNNTCIFYKSISQIREKVNEIIENSEVLLKYCYTMSSSINQRQNKNIYLQLSLIDTLESISLKDDRVKSLENIEEILLFLHKLGIIRIEGGLFMFWTKFNIKKSNNFNEQFTNENYQDLKDYYDKKIENVHIMGEYVKKISNKNDPIGFVNNYFALDYQKFLDKHFKGRKGEIKRSMTLELYNKLFGELSDEQKEIIESSGNSLIIAGPGAGKTRTIVHKVISLILKEGIRKEEFLLLSFSRSAKFEIKKRVIELLGKEGYYLNIHTFHSFAFKLLGREAKETDTVNIIKEANQYLKDNDAMLPYSVIVLDEFQDINDDQYEMVKLIRERSSKSEEMKIIATGDDDQSIYGFQGGNIKHIKEFKKDYGAIEYILTTNYRSNQKIIDISSGFIDECKDRIKYGKKLKSSRSQDLFSDTSTIKIINFMNNNYVRSIEDQVKTLLGKNNHLGILCYTNEKVLEIAFLLKQSGYENCEILLSKTGYKLDDTPEFMEFIETFEEQKDIKESDLLSAYQKIVDKFGANKNIHKLKIAIDMFLKENKKIYSRSIKDYFLGIKENEIMSGDEQITISTLHKAKGKEFDSVMLFFDEERDWNKDINDQKEMDAIRRLIYVGLTRAKENLLVLGKTDNMYFKKLYSLFDKKEDIDNQNDIGSSERIIEDVTSLEDINLGYNIIYYNSDKYGYIDIGTKVAIDIHEQYCDFIFNGNVIQRSSKGFCAKIQKKFINKGFQVSGVEVFQRVVYHLKDKGKEAVIYLFLIHRKK